MDNINELIKKAQAGDTEAKEILVSENLGLVRSIVPRFLHRGVDYEDLFQLGSIGLIKAIDRFDITRELKFSTYAVPMIIGEIRRFFRDDGSIKINRRIKELSYKVMRAKDEFVQKNGREPTISELAEATEIDVETIIEVLETVRPMIYFDDIVSNNSDNTLTVKDTVADDDESSDKIIEIIALKDSITKLKGIERQIIFFRFFKDKTQTETAKLLGISQVQVSRIERKVLIKMKQNLAEFDDKTLIANK